MNIEFLEKLLDKSCVELQAEINMKLLEIEIIRELLKEAKKAKEAKEAKRWYKDVSWKEG